MQPTPDVDAIRDAVRRFSVRAMQSDNIDQVPFNDSLDVLDPNEPLGPFVVRIWPRSDSPEFVVLRAQVERAMRQKVRLILVFFFC